MAKLLIKEEEEAASVSWSASVAGSRSVSAPGKLGREGGGSAEGEVSRRERGRRSESDGHAKRRGRGGKSPPG